MATLRNIAKKVAMCFPDEIPKGQEYISFNIPAYIIEELRQVLKETKMSTPVTVQNKIQLLHKDAEKKLISKLKEMGKELNNDHTLVLDILAITPEICRPLALACELTNC